MVGGDQGVGGEEGHQGRGEGERGGPVRGEQLQEHRGLEPAHTGVTRVTASSCCYLGRVTVRPPWCSMPDIVTFSPKMWYRGSTQTVTSSCNEEQSEDSVHYMYCTVLCCTGLTSWNTLNLGWRYCAICAVRLPWVSSTPFATPVVPLL